MSAGAKRSVLRPFRRSRSPSIPSSPPNVSVGTTQLAKLSLDLQKKFHVFGRSGAFIYGLSAIDIALWDIAGKVAKQPVHQLLGGSDATSLPAYASLTRYSDPELVAKNVARALSSGYRRLKLHEIDLDCVRAAREAAGDDIEIMLDVNCPWSVREALGTGLAARELFRACAGQAGGRYSSCRRRECIDVDGL